LRAGLEAAEHESELATSTGTVFERCWAPPDNEFIRRESVHSMANIPTKRKAKVELLVSELNYRIPATAVG
jgi:hypothetical protein